MSIKTQSFVTEAEAVPENEVMTKRQERTKHELCPFITKRVETKYLPRKSFPLLRH